MAIPLYPKRYVGCSQFSQNIRVAVSMGSIQEGGEYPVSHTAEGLGSLIAVDTKIQIHLGYSLGAEVSIHIDKMAELHTVADGERQTFQEVPSTRILA